MGAHLTAHADLQRLVSNAHGAAPRMLTVQRRECSAAPHNVAHCECGSARDIPQMTPPVLSVITATKSLRSSPRSHVHGVS